MKRIDERTIEMTDKEMEVWEVFNQILDEGHGIADAAKYAVSAMPKPSPAFVEYLSDGTLTYVNGLIETLPGGRP